MKKIISVLLVSIMSLAIFAGCSNTKNNSNQETSEDNSLNYVLDKGQLVLGLDDSFPPMGFRDSNGEIVGFDIDLAREVAEILEVDLVLQPIDWAAKEMELSAKNIDCIWNGLTISEERKQAMTISEPYLANDMIFVVKGDSEYKEIEDLYGKNIAIQSSSMPSEILESDPEFKNSFKNIYEFPDCLTAMLDLESGGSEGVFVDGVLARYFITESGKDFRILDEVVAEKYFGIAFRKGEENLEKAVSDALEQLVENGKVAEICEKWFSEDVFLK